MGIFAIQVFSVSSVTDELDIWRGAQAVIKKYGEDAWFHASCRADELLEEGDLEGSATWRKILAAIQELQRNEPKDGEKLN